MRIVDLVLMKRSLRRELREGGREELQLVVVEELRATTTRGGRRRVSRTIKSLKESFRFFRLVLFESSDLYEGEVYSL